MYDVNEYIDTVGVIDTATYEILQTVREVAGLDIVWLFGKHLEGNTAYLASASCYACKGILVTAA